MPRLSVRLLGPFQVTLDDQPLASFNSDKTRALLAYLAVEADRPHRRERLAYLLWPDSLERDARTSLRTALNELRKIIGDRHAALPFLTVSRSTIQLNTESDCWCDVLEFETLVSAVHRSQPPTSLSARQLEQAVALYRGDFLEGFSLSDSSDFDDWVLVEQEYLHRLAMDALEWLAEWYEDRHQIREALVRARRLVELDNLVERSHRRLMRLLALDDQREAALAQYEACGQLLQQELGVAPEEQTTALYEQILAGEISPMTPTTHPLQVVNKAARPDRCQTFRNRAAELAWLRTRMAEPATRLVSVVGRGGYGKTALVVQAIIEAEQGVLHLGDSELLVRGVAYFHPRITGLTLGRLYADLGVILGEPFASILASHWQDPTASLARKAYFLLEQVMRAISDHEVLLVVLDSLESALDDTGELIDDGLRLWLEAYLASGGPLRILVTSRKEWHLPDSAIPYVRQWNLEHGLPEDEAVAVLHALDPDGRSRLLDADQILLHWAIQRTDGVPFSLEKITGLLHRNRQLTLEQLLADDAIFEKEVTLALAERAFSHLCLEEQQVMEVLAVYDRPVPVAAVAYGLAALTEKEDLPVAEAALQELARSYFVTYQADDKSWGLHEVDAQAAYLRLNIERCTILHRRAGEFYERQGTEQVVLDAARHFQQAGDHEKAARLATDHAEAINNQGQAAELRRLLAQFTEHELSGTQWVRVNVARGENYEFLGEEDLAKRSYEVALSSLAAFPDSREVRIDKARACRGMGMLLEFDAPLEALDWLRRGLEELDSVDAEEEAALHIRLGTVAIGAGQHDVAEREFKRGLELLPEGLSRMRASALGNLGLIQCMRGEVKDGTLFYRRALEISEQLNDYWRIVGLRHNLAIEADIAGDWVGARTEYQDALSLAKQLGSVEQQATIELSLGNVQIKLGDDKAAASHLTACLTLSTDHSLREYAVAGRCSLAKLYLETGQSAAAEPLLAEAERIELEREAQDQLTEIYSLQALTLLTCGQHKLAVDRAHRAVDLAHQAELEHEKGVALRVFGQVLHANGEVEQATIAFEQSYAILEELDPYEAARTRMQSGLCLCNQGIAEQGQKLLQEALEIFQRLGARRDSQVTTGLLYLDF